jgi:hypothetical protein
MEFVVPSNRENVPCKNSQCKHNNKKSFRGIGVTTFSTIQMAHSGTATMFTHNVYTPFDRLFLQLYSWETPSYPSDGSGITPEIDTLAGKSPI